MGTSTLKALWEKHWDYFSLFFTPFTSSHFRGYNNWLWLKSFQATCTITKYNDNIHNGNKRMSLLNLHVTWIEMLILIICLYKEFVWIFFGFHFLSSQWMLFCFLLLCMLYELGFICVCWTWFISVALYSFKKPDFKNGVLDITFVFCIATPSPIINDLDQREV